MIPGDTLPKLSRKRLILLGLVGLGGLGGLVVTAGLSYFVVSAMFGMPPSVFGFNEAPDQPIDFPHTVHVQQLGLDCTFCHRNVARSEAATVPSVGLCMTCHKSVGLDKPEVEKLRAFHEAGQPIDWVRVHRVPDFVHFVHADHIRFFSQRDAILPSETCQLCHGDVGGMTKVKQVRTLKMGDCVDCHRDNSAPTDCSTCHY